MFIEHIIDVSKNIVSGENILVVEFHVMSEMSAKKKLSEGY